MEKLEEALNERLAGLIANDLAKPGLGNIDLHKTRKLIMDAGAVLLDVRPVAKVEGENAEEAGIKNACYMPYTEFADYTEQLPCDKTTPIVVACLKGWFANRIMGYLEMMGYSNVYVLDRSIVNLIETHRAHTDQ